MHLIDPKSAGDHPRSRGVYSRRISTCGADWGSSPLARGLRSAHPYRRYRPGIIPARAGFTARCTVVHETMPDHPRSRGGYKVNGRYIQVPKGSSPLARGLRGTPRPPPVSTRIIPARAGFTPSTRRWRSRRRDHPRSRGVYEAHPDHHQFLRGSSPLARGLRGVGQEPAQRRGIIPARAGFTESARYQRKRPGDHPRSRGVYPPPSAAPSRTRGSSPLARGLPPVDLAAVGPGRIIPARAGFTVCRGFRRRPGRDHPRSRGVYSRFAFRFVRTFGIIPARAGFTTCSRPCPARRRDHPRSRGVYGNASGVLRIEMGSSPLARGLLPRPLTAIRTRGIIPARAGFTWPSTGPPRSSRDHPRSRGVYDARRRGYQSSPGSSPLARGLLAALAEGVRHALDHPRSRGVYCGGGYGPASRRGIIPARAGFTSPPSPTPWAAADHPRSRGVYHYLVPGRHHWRGSSPLARGLRPGADRRVPARGIIPARAGFTPRPPRRPARPGDHPRSRGVYKCSISDSKDDNGSSPLARGLRHAAVLCGSAGGIIPARAGFTARHDGGRPAG